MNFKILKRKLNMFLFNKIYFSKIRESAIIPTKREEDAAYDLYSCFDEDYIIIQPHTVRLIPTGIASAFYKRWCFVFEERGSTGVKNMKRNAGVIDSGYRNEWFVAISNANEKPIVIAKDINAFSEKDYIIYPYNKAIAQTLKKKVYKNTNEEISYDEIKLLASERMMGKIGSSGK
jgi:dUTP pyrophosphatase